MRHGKTRVDSQNPISEWVLSDKGLEQSKSLADLNVFKDIDCIYASSEKKAYQTAKPIALKLGKEITQFSEIRELDRDHGDFLDREKYEETVKYSFENREESVNNWETASAAIQRFTNKITEIDREQEDKNILIVGHGMTINMYFADVLGAANKTHERFNENTFAYWGIIKNGQVIRDLSS